MCVYCWKKAAYILILKLEYLLMTLIYQVNIHISISSISYLVNIMYAHRNYLHKTKEMRRLQEARDCNQVTRQIDDQRD